MKKKESQLEKDCIKEARRRGWVCWKNENNGNKGIPDYSLLSRDGKFIMIEFKRDSAAQIKPEQLIWKEKFSKIVYFCHNFNDFIAIIDKFQ